MKYFLFLSLFCTVAMQAADQQPKKTDVYVNITGENPRVYKEDSQQKIWDVADRIATEHNLTINGVFTICPHNGMVTALKPNTQSLLSIIRVPLQIGATRKQATLNQTQST